MPPSSQIEEWKNPKTSKGKMHQPPQHDCREWARVLKKVQGLEQKEEFPEHTK